MKYFNILLLTASLFMNVSLAGCPDDGGEPLSKRQRTQSTEELSREANFSLKNLPIELVQVVIEYLPNQLNFILAVQDWRVFSDSWQSKFELLKKTIAHSAVVFHAETSSDNDLKMVRQNAKAAKKEITDLLNYSNFLQNDKKRLRLDIAIHYDAEWVSLLQIQAGFVVRSLKVLSIEYYHGFESFSQNLESFTNLEALDLSNDDHDKSSLEYLVPSIAKLVKKLRSLRLSFGDIKDTGVKQLTLALNEAEVINLESLDLSSNNIEKEGIQALISSLAKAKNLRELNMGDALFTQDSIDTLIPILRNFTNFNRLELYGTELSTQNACNIISCIPHLQYLDISFNELEIEGFEETLKCLPISTSYFAFRNNRLVDADVTRIVAAMKTAAHVKFIDLNDNNFSDEGAENLCEQIASLQTKVEISRYYAGDDA